MPDITALEQRIAAAFDRMDQGLERLARAKPPFDADPQPGPPSAALGEAPITEASPQLPALLRALESAKASAADWADRYRALQVQMGDETLAMASEITRLTALLDAAQAANPAPVVGPDRDAEIDDLTARIAQQEAELETLRALRAGEAADIGDLVAALAPLVEEVPHV